MRENYELKNEYTEEIPKLLDTDPASATDTFNPLIQKVINNIHSVKTNLETCDKQTISSEAGVHGLRYHEEQLEVKVGGEWTEVGGSGGIAVGNVTGLSCEVGNGKLTLKWSDPGDIVASGVIIGKWKGTKLLMKAGAYPENEKDGQLLLDNQVRDNYKTNGFVVNNLTNDTTYYFGLYPYTDQKVVTRNETKRINGTPKPYKIMTVKINLNDSNPETCCTYYDDAVGMIPGNDAWDEFFGHYPCLFKNGQEVGKLQRNDFTKFEDGRHADIESGNAGDVMICFPKRAVKIETVGDILAISMTKELNVPGFKCYAHTRGATIKDKFYLGAYKGYETGGKLRSLSRKTPTDAKTIDYFRNIAKSNGYGYDQSAFYQLLYRQVMYILKYKNLNSNRALGQGYTKNDGWFVKTGATDQKGMDFGENTGKYQMKLFGIEDMWGNLFEYFDGAYCNEDFVFLSNTTNFNNEAAGYKRIGKLAENGISGGYMSKPMGTTETGFIIKENKASETTFFCNTVYLNSNHVFMGMGTYSSNKYGNYAGIFNLSSVSATENVAIGTRGARLMYL